MIPVMTECNVPAVFASKRSTNDFLIAWVDKAAPKFGRTLCQEFQAIPVWCKIPANTMQKDKS